MFAIALTYDELPDMVWHWANLDGESNSNM